MPDREKVIKGLECCLKNDCHIDKCPYCEFIHNEYVCLEDYLMRDALALLKEQEAVEPRISESYRTNSGRMSRRKAWCGACGIGINMDAKFCDHCGRQVKWNDSD